MSRPDDEPGDRVEWSWRSDAALPGRKSNWPTPARWADQVTHLAAERSEKTSYLNPYAACDVTGAGGRCCYGRRMHTRVTGICVEDERILLLEQDTDGPRRFSLPGGKVEDGETLAGALVREMAEETGADVTVGRLLYVCDHLPAALVHITFEVRRVGGTLGAIAGTDTRQTSDHRVSLRWLGPGRGERSGPCRHGTGLGRTLPARR